MDNVDIMVSRKPSLMPSYWGSSSVCSHHTSSMIASHCWSFSVCLLPDLTGEISFPQKNHLRDSLWIGRQSLCPGVLGVCACMGVFRNKPGTQGQTLKRNENVKSMGFIQQQQRLRTFWGGEHSDYGVFVPETQERQVRSLSWEDPVEVVMAIHSSILA